MESNATGSTMRRLQHELRAMLSAPDSVSAGPIDDDILTWEATFTGPEDTVWEGGVFRLHLQFTDQYPNEPPRVKFLSTMFHPNVYADGRICMDILKSHWSPSTDVMSLILSIQSMLPDPNLDSPANPSAADLFRSNRSAYDSKVRQIVDASLAE
jgi:ubiquitin-conjugating enzyme E2 A